MARIRYRVHARSIRAGIMVARGIQYEPGGMIDWELFLRAYLRTKDAIPYKPYQCGSCGYTVPLVGSRREQASRAVEHWFIDHEERGRGQ